MKRTYEVGLLAVSQKVYRYGTRWNNQLKANLTTHQYTCLQALVNAALECVQALQAGE